MNQDLIIATPSISYIASPEEGSTDSLEMVVDELLHDTEVDISAADVPGPHEDLSAPEPGEAIEEVPIVTDVESRPVILFEPSARRAIRARVLDCLRATGRFFERSGVIVMLRRDSLDGQLTIEEVNSAELALALDEITAWERFDARRKAQIRMDVPEQFCATLLRTSVSDVLQPLAGIARQPFLRPDGSICLQSGYDPTTAIYGDFRPGDFPVPTAPSRDDAMASLNALLELVEEFPFDAPADKAAAVTALLTAALRPSLPTAPMFHVRAHVPGTGKSLLCAVISTLATPEMGAPQSFPSTNDECDKVLLALLKGGSPVIEFDNLTGDIVPFKKLCTVLTSERVSGRRLGTSQTLNVSTRSLILSSGNNVGPVGDMTRRCITINLDARCETPAMREFKRPDLLQHVREHRNRYVAAALTILKAWMAAGRPVTRCAAVNSYEAWSAWCRHPLLWLGLVDPATSIYQAHAEDADRQALGQLLALLHRLVGSTPVMVRELVNLAEPLGKAGDDEELALLLRDLLEDVSNSQGRGIDRRRLGWWLKHHTGHAVQGLRLESVPRSLNAQSWRVVQL